MGLCQSPKALLWLICMATVGLGNPYLAGQAAGPIESRKETRTEGKGLWGDMEAQSESDETKRPFDLIVVKGNSESPRLKWTSAGSLIPVDPMELPLSVEILPSSLLNERYTTEFYDTLQYVSGAFTGGRTSFSVSSGRPTLRGFMGNEVLLGGLVLPSRMPIFLDAQGISRIEFYKGPLNSAIGGQSGLQGSGGAVNIIGKSPDLGTIRQEISIGGTFGNGYSVRVAYDGNIPIGENLAIRLPLALNDESPFYLPDKFKSDRSWFIGPILKWQCSPETAVTVEATYQDKDKMGYQGIPYLKKRFLVPVDTYYGNRDSRNSYQGVTGLIRLEHEIEERLRFKLGVGYAMADEARKHWSVTANAPRGSGLTTEQYYDQVIATETAPYSFTQGSYYDENKMIFGQVDYGFDIDEVDNQVTIGGDYLRRKTDGLARSGSTGWLSLHDPDLQAATMTPFTSVKSHLDRFGVYLQDYAGWASWRLLLGARTDFHKSQRGNETVSVSPRAGLTYLVSEDVSIYGNYTLASGPNFGQNDIRGEELTDSWRSQMVEPGIKIRLIDDLWATASVFQIDQKNTPEVDPDDPTGLSFVTTGHNRSRGAEIGFNGEFLKYFGLLGSYTYLDYEDVDDHISFTRFPRNTLALWASVRCSEGPLEGLRAGLGFRHSGGYCTTFRGAYISSDYMIESSNVVDFSIEYPLQGLLGDMTEVKLEFGIKNLFDEEYVESNRHGTENFPGIPRTFWMRLSAAIF